MATSLTLEQFFGKETKINEFKQFSFKINPSVYFSMKEIEHILITGLWNKKLSHLIIGQLNMMFKYYISKYVSCFLNAQILGNIYFGIDDDGIVKGIPSKIPITQSMVKKMILKNMNKYLKMSSKNIKHLYQHKITVSIKKLKIDPLIVDQIDFSKIIKQYHHKKNIYTEQMRDFKIKKQEWLDLLNQYRSLHLVVNIPKHKLELIAYIQENVAFNISEQIIQELNSVDFVKIPSGFELEHYKKNPSSKLYWIMKFKDFKINQICSKKPIKPDCDDKFKLYHLLTNICNLNSYFISDQEIDFYLIHIQINGLNNIKNVLFKYPDSSEWLYRSRTMINGEPACICS